MSAASSRANEWHIKFASKERLEYVRRQLKSTAAANGLTIGELLERFADQGLQATPANDTGNHKQSGTQAIDEKALRAAVKRHLTDHP